MKPRSRQMMHVFRIRPPDAARSISSGYVHGPPEVVRPGHPTRRPVVSDRIGPGEDVTRQRRVRTIPVHKAAHFGNRRHAPVHIAVILRAALACIDPVRLNQCPFEREPGRSQGSLPAFQLARTGKATTIVMDKPLAADLPHQPAHTVCHRPVSVCDEPRRITAIRFRAASAQTDQGDRDTCREKQTRRGSKGGNRFRNAIA